jgi:branched-subunit amino acid transport protein
MWTAILLGSLVCYALKLAGVSVPERALADPRLRRVAALLPVALLMALTATQTFISGDQLVLDARTAGLAAAVVAVVLRAPFLVVVVVAAGTAAAVRAVG